MNRMIVIVGLGVTALQPTAALSETSCTDPDTIEEERDVADEKTIEQVQEACTDEWMAIPGVEGTGIGLCDGQPCIKVYSSRPAEELREQIPQTVEGYRVKIEKTEPFRAFE